MPLPQSLISMRFPSIKPVLMASAFSLAVVAGFASAQTYQFNTVQVTGNQRIETATILTYIGIGRGEAVTAGEVNEAAQRLRDTGLFADVRVVPNGGTLLIEVVEYATINQISIEGNSRLDDAEIASVVRSQPRRVLNPTQVEADTNAIANLYAQSGRINARVTPKIIERSSNRVDLVFEVFEGGITEVESIGFAGNREFSDWRLRRVLDTKQAGLLRLLISRDTYSQERVEFDRQLLTDFYRSRGYADFQVKSIDVQLTRERDANIITYNVQEGQRFQFGSVGVSSSLPGVDLEPFQKAIRTRSGSYYSPVDLENDIARLEDEAIRQGLSFVRVDPQITRNDRNLTLDVNFVLLRGPRIFIERIDIEGNATTLDRVIRNQFDSVEGDPFNPREIRKSAERIRALGYFSNADVNAREGTAEDRVIVDVNVEEQPTGSLSFGANYNSDDGVGLIASFRESNFLGRGQKLNFAISTASSNRSASFSFAEPNLLGRDLNFGLDLSYNETDNANARYDTRNFRFSPSLTFPVSERGRLRVFYATKYTDIFDVTSESAPIIADAERGGLWAHSLGYNYSWDSRRNEVDPTSALVLRFGQEFGVGDDQYIKSTAFAAAETKVLNEELTLRAIFEGGYLHYSEGSSRITDRWFMGSRVMRGFEPGGIGPRDATTDDALGGNAYAVVRLEAEFPLGLPEEYGIHGGAFVDYGSLWDTGIEDTSDVLYDDFTARSVAGVSLFWETPVGPLRFNYSEPIDVQELDRPRSFDVTLSTSF